MWVSEVKILVVAGTLVGLEKRQFVVGWWYLALVLLLVQSPVVRVVGVASSGG